MTKVVVFADSTDMKITLPSEQAEILSSKETIREVIKKNPDMLSFLSGRIPDPPDHFSKSEFGESLE